MMTFDKKQLYDYIDKLPFEIFNIQIENTSSKYNEGGNFKLGDIYSKIIHVPSRCEETIEITITSERSF